MFSTQSSQTAMYRRSIAAIVLALGSAATAAPPPPATWPGGLPAPLEMVAARTDVWGEAAMSQPDGASYEFFRDLLPRLRWVNAEFRHYPLVLIAPRSPVKARFISNGSAVNARANKPPMWFEAGTPVKFSVGDPPEPFGQDIARLEDARYANGYLPVVRVGYRHGSATYVEEAFAPVEPELASRGAIMLRFKTEAPGAGRMEARVETDAALHAAEGVVFNEKKEAIIAFGPGWSWQQGSKSLIAALPPGESRELTIFTAPATASEPMSPQAFDRHRQACIDHWQALLAAGTHLTTPEPIVNDAWRALLIGNFMIASSNRMHYSAGNAYAKLYQGECGDALRSLLLFGHADVSRDMLKPLLEFNRQATRFHVAGHKLQLLAWYYWVTRDAESVRTHEPVWRPFLELILTSREADSGLLPKDNYAGDINRQVYSLNSNANCWRGLRDAAAMLDEMGRKDEAKRLFDDADRYRKVILDAVAKSERRDARPPFIPVALLADEPAHDPLTATRIGSYYDLMAPYVIGSEIFPFNSDRQTWLLEYLQKHGGIAMGMVRTRPAQGQFEGEPSVVPLYTLRYWWALLQRDEREKALVGFYGHLARGMVPHTFVGGEGVRFMHGDADGRSFYLPPNSASNAAFLLLLRYLIVEDWDLDGNGRPETLRLLYGVPRRWLKDGGSLSMERAPSLFGDVSLQVQSRLSAGEVTVRVTAPPRPPRKVLLRVPLPGDWKTTGASIDGASLTPAADGAVDLTGRTGTYTVRFTVAPQQHVR